MMAITSLSHLGRRTAAGTLLAVAGLTAAVTAQASYVVGQWDPEYGVPFTNLGWRGTTTLLVDDSCLASAGLVPNNGVACPVMTVLNAMVEFYNLTDPLLATVEALNFGSSVALNSIEVDGAGQVTGFMLLPTALVVSTSPLARYGTSQGSFGLSINSSFSATVASTTLANLSWLTDEGLGRNDPRFPAVVHITTTALLPEPGSLALAGVALSMLLTSTAMTRRRRGHTALQAAAPAV